MKNSWFSLIVWIVICLSIGFVGAIFTPGEWYQALQKSPLTPPNYVFPIVLNILVVLMGVAAWRIWEKREQGVVLALSLFFIQLFLNGIWSFLFFGIHRPDIALIEIILLWSAILFAAIAFYKLDKIAGILLIPYLVWVSFAIYLNYSFVQINNF